MSGYTAAAKEAYACAPSDVAIIETIELYHPSLPEPIYLVQNPVDLTLGLENDGGDILFEASAFRITLPASGENGIQALALAIDNVDRRISDFLNNAKNFQSPVQCIYRPYLEDNLTTPELDPPLVLSLSDVQVTKFDVTASANFGDLLNKKFLSILYRRDVFRSLAG